MTERHFYLVPKSEYGPNYIVAVRSYGQRREWHVYEERTPRVWYGSGVSIGSITRAKEAARAALERTLDTSVANPISHTLRNALISAVCVVAVGALYEALKPKVTT